MDTLSRWADLAWVPCPLM